MTRRNVSAEVTEQREYRERIAAEGKFWDQEFLHASESQVFPCVFHASSFFRDRITQRYLEKIVAGLSSESSALDLGCGKGWLTRIIAGTGAKTLGVDVAEECVAQGNAQARAAGITNCSFEVMDANVGELRQGAYDLVVSWGALHHLIRLDHVVEQVARSLRPGGRFVLVECVDQVGLRGKLAHALADFFHLILPTDRTYAAKLRHGWAKLTGGKQEFEWSPFENAGGGSWREAMEKRFEVVEHEESMSFMSAFAGRVRLPEGLNRIVLGGLFLLDRALVATRILPAEYHFMVLRVKPNRPT